ncbi:Hsp33 family molecular chaperone HslO [Stakelama saccharophila]|uniref:Hsp33 family molecular chaperone HslO n=1 Tax=Stakelama saccharophila TaxID=3075605 RepID=A0ABZ0BBT7_9SPHN|nr:Hsp33 family molecular chaperone HslO [Stakelama sp. W311]WNO54762.1 Hsp33 family molecular chaperone HslO [Stakelama sp. W311]
MTVEPASTPDLDRAIGFTIPERDARGRMVRLGPVLEEILSAHAYPPVIEKLLGEALALTALLGTTLKDVDGQLTMQAQTQNGIVDLMVCDYKGGELRGYVQFDEAKLAEAPDDPTLFALFGNGFLGVTFDQVTTGERYQGIVPLDGASLSEAAESYFAQSEQIPSLVRLGVRHDGDGRVVAGGLFLQYLPDGEEGRDRIHTRLDHPQWEHVEALAATMGVDELVDAAVPMETLVWRLFNEEREVRMPSAVPLVRGCRCDAAYITQVLAKFAPEQRREMADENGVISVDCAFCARQFPVPLETLAS